MESEFVKNYFDWNDALRRYFLTESELSVKLLCVDDAVLDEIGEKYNIIKNVDESYHNHFKKSVALSTEGRNELQSFLEDHLGCHLSRGRGSSLFQIANRFSTVIIPSEAPERYDLPSLAFTALFVSLCSNDRHPRSSVIQSISSLTGNSISDEEGGFDYIPNLLSAISLYDKTFDNNRRGARVNVGPLQYQKVLSQREIFLFKKFLYTNNIFFDETISSYADFMNFKILGRIKSGEFRPLYQRLVQNNRFVHEDYFTRQIQSFNRDEFEAELSRADTSIQITGTFYLVISFSSDQRVRFGVYTDVHVRRPVVTQFGVIPLPVGEPVNGLYPTDIKCDSLESYCSLSYSDKDYFFSLSHGCTGPIYFRESGNFLVQNHAPEPNSKYYVFIKRQNQKAIDNLKKQQSFEEVDFLGLFGNEWQAYLVPNWIPQKSEQKVIKSEFSIKGGTGISVPGKRDFFFNNGLPFVIIPDNYECSRITIVRDIVGNGPKTLKRVIHKNKDRAYIDLLSPPRVSDPNEDFRIIVKDRTNIIDSYSIYFPSIDKVSSSSTHLFSYDGWNLICGDDGKPVIKDNRLYNCAVVSYNTVNLDAESHVSTWNEQECSYRFIELLRASYLESGVLSSKSINEVINYLAGYYDLPTIENKSDEYHYLRSALVNLGFLNKSYDENGYSIYQIASPRLFPAGIDRYGDTKYLLYGAYIKDQIKSLCNITPRFGYIRPFTDDAKDKHYYLAFIPYYMMVSLNKEQIERVKNLGISIEENSLSDIILSLVNSPALFSRDFMTLENQLPNDSYDGAESYPRTVYSYGRWRLEDHHSVYDSYKPDNQKFRRVPIPSSLMKQYCRHLSNSPVCLVDKMGDRMAFLEDMPIPGLYKKCLAYLNLGLPEIRIVFDLDGILGADLVQKIIEYKVKSDNCDVIACKLSGNAYPRFLQYQTFKSNRYTLYYVKSNHIYEPYQIQLYLKFNSSPLAYVKKIKDTYSVFKRENNQYYKLDYTSPKEAISALLSDDLQLNNHIIRDVTDEGPLSGNNVYKKEITIIQRYEESN